MKYKYYPSRLQFAIYRNETNSTTGITWNYLSTIQNSAIKGISHTISGWKWIIVNLKIICKLVVLCLKKLRTLIVQGMNCSDARTSFFFFLFDIKGLQCLKRMKPKMQHVPRKKQWKFRNTVWTYQMDGVLTRWEKTKMYLEGFSKNCRIHKTCKCKLWNTLDELQAILHSSPLTICSPSMLWLENSSPLPFLRLFLQKQIHQNKYKCYLSIGMLRSQQFLFIKYLFR